MLPELHPVDEHAAEREFKDAMSELVHGVVLVTCSVAGRVWGTTVTSIASVSADPPTVLVSLRTDSTAARAVAAAGRYGVAVLGAHQVALARACSVPGARKFVAAEALTGALARLECDVMRSAVVGDHTVFIARVRVAEASAEAGEPLLHHRRSYLCPSS